MNRYYTGLRAETIAAWWLRFKGYRILGQRLKTPLGEVDLLATRGKTLAIVEVKQRPTHGDAAGAISNQQQKRLIRAASFLLAGHPELGQHTVRFDALLVNSYGLPRHIINAWSV